MDFPLYALRKNYEHTVENGIVYIHSYHNKYVIDDRNIQSESFLERRVLMLDNEYDFPIYALKYKCENRIQVNSIYRSNGYNQFIDVKGNILKYTPSKRVDIHWKKCKTYAHEGGQYYTAVVVGEPYSFTVKDRYNYLAIITLNGGRYIYDTSFTKPEKEVMWRKI